MRGLNLCSILIGGAVLSCSPALDWREVRPEGAGARVLFPCKPRSQARIATIAASAVAMTMLACSAGGVTFALSHAELGDSTRATLALSELRLALAANLNASDVRTLAFGLPGMTPNPQAKQIWLSGRLPDGTLVQERAVLFVHGTHIYQTAMLGVQIDEATAETFFDSLRLTP